MPPGLAEKDHGKWRNFLLGGTNLKIKEPQSAQTSASPAGGKTMNKKKRENLLHRNLGTYEFGAKGVGRGDPTG